MDSWRRRGIPTRTIGPLNAAQTLRQFADLHLARITHRRATRLLALQFVLEKLGQNLRIVELFVLRSEQQGQRAMARPVEQRPPMLRVSRQLVAVMQAEIVETLGDMAEGLAQLGRRRELA